MRSVERCHVKPVSGALACADIDCHSSFRAMYAAHAGARVVFEKPLMRYQVSAPLLWGRGTPNTDRAHASATLQYVVHHQCLHPCWSVCTTCMPSNHSTQQATDGLRSVIISAGHLRRPSARRSSHSARILAQRQTLCSEGAVAKWDFHDRDPKGEVMSFIWSCAVPGHEL